MKYPKLWDGVTPVGEGYIRSMQNLGLPTGLVVGEEIRDDGSLGKVTARSVNGFNEVHREGVETTVARAFLSTWQSDEVQLLDKNLPPTSQHLTAPEGFPKFISSSVFVGDGFFVGVVASDDTPNAPATFAPLLCRLPRTYPAVSVASYLALDAAARRKSSVLLASTTIAKLRPLYVVPLGWQNEAKRYTFAVVTDEVVATADSSPARQIVGPKIFIGNTGDFSLEPLPTGLGFDWSWNDAGTTGDVTTSLVTCTGPGKLEFIVLKPESDSVTETVIFFGTAPTTFYYVGTPTTPPATWPPLVLGPLYTPLRPAYPPSFPPDTPSYISLPDTVTVRVAYRLPTIVPRRSSFYVVSSSDFGATWTSSNEPGLEESTHEQLPYEAPLNGGVSTDAFPPEPISPPVFGMYFGVGRVDSTYHPETTIGFGDPWPTTWYNSVVTRFPTPVSYPTGVPKSNRGLTVRPLAESFSLVGAGDTTFAMITGLDPDTPVNTTNTLTRDFADALNNTTTTPITVAATLYPTLSGLHMYRRTGAGAFERVPWPGDALATQFRSNYFPPDWTEKLNSNVLGIGRQPIYSTAWASTGEGRAVFILLRMPGPSPIVAEDVTALIIGTIDGGATWKTLTVDGTDNFRDFCVIEPDASDRHACILFSTKVPGTDKRQLMRVASDLSGITTYGPRYTATRGGLVNFRKFVHPGFPGSYDEPPP